MSDYVPGERLEIGVLVRWEKARRWVVRTTTKATRIGTRHHTYGVIAMSVEEAIEEVRRRHPDDLIESVNDTGAVDYVASNLPVITPA